MLGMRRSTIGTGRSIGKEIKRGRGEKEGMRSSKMRRRRRARKFVVQTLLFFEIALSAFLRFK